MTNRILICIGCNDYQDAVFFGELSAAENDASNVFEELTKAKSGNYDSRRSKLLRSPTLEEVRQTLRELAVDREQMQTLTFFFAGHAAVHRGSLYLCLKDTDGAAMSMSALSLSELLRLVADKQVPQTNIILDACQTGGLLVDLGALLQTDAIGARNTPGVTLLAMAALDESALEDGSGGFGTQVLLECLRGDRVISKERPTLDLMDIGREVSSAFSSTDEQKPVFWGLNLADTSNFCVNPNYEKSTGRELPGFPAATADASVIVDEYSRQSLWKIYLELSRSWDRRSFYDLMKRVLTQLETQPAQQAALAERIALSFAEQATGNDDQAVSVEVYAICSLALLPWSSETKIVDETCERLLKTCASLAAERLQSLSELMRSDLNALLSHKDGSFDFYFLPVRISKILGWASFASIAADTSTSRDSRRALLKSLIEMVHSSYPLCLTAMTDEQAAPTALIGAALFASNFHDDLELLLSAYLNSLAEQKGLIAPADLPFTEIFDYLSHRVRGDLRLSSQLTARPSEFLAVCMRLASIASMQDVLDAFLIDLDHSALNTFFPADYLDIGADVLVGGTNVTMTVGQDVFTVSEFENHWPQAMIPQPKTQAQRLANMASSLLFPNRVAWFELSVLGLTTQSHAA